MRLLRSLHPIIQQHQTFPRKSTKILPLWFWCILFLRIPNFRRLCVVFIVHNLLHDFNVLCLYSCEKSRRFYKINVVIFKGVKAKNLQINWNIRDWLLFSDQKLGVWLREIGIQDHFAFDVEFEMVWKATLSKSVLIDRATEDWFLMTILGKAYFTFSLSRYKKYPYLVLNGVLPCPRTRFGNALLVNLHDCTL